MGNLLNEKVKTVKFGEGVVVRVKGDRLYIKFSEEDDIKEYSYPRCYDIFIDEKVRKLAKKDYENMVLEKQEREKGEKEVKELLEKAKKADAEKRAKLLGELPSEAKQIEALKHFVNSHIGQSFTAGDIIKAVEKLVGTRNVSIAPSAYRYNVKAKGDSEINLFYYIDYNTYLCVGENWDGKIEKH